MWNIALGASIMMISLVITREQILTAIPLGAPKDTVESYFTELTDDISYITRETPRQGTVSHELAAGESGYYVIGLADIKERWWHLSLGKFLAVIVVITEEDLVSEIKFFQSVRGWP